MNSTANSHGTTPNTEHGIPSAKTQAKILDNVTARNNIRWYVGGQLASFFGTFLQSAVTCLLIVELVPKQSATYWVGMYTSLVMLPAVFLGLFAGVLLDIWDKRRILIVTSVLGVAYSLAQVYFTWTGKISMTHVVSIAVISGIINSIDGPGRTAIINDATNPENVRSSTKLLMFMVSVGQTLGPAFAGILVINCGYSFTFLINAISFLVLIGALLKMKIITQVHVHEVNMFQTATKKIGTTLRYMSTDKPIRLCTVLMTLSIGLGYSYNALLAVIAPEMFNGGPIVYSHLGMSAGIGSLLSGLFVVRFDKIMKHSHLVIGGNLLIGTGLCLLSRASNPLTGEILIGIMSFGLMGSVTVLRSSIAHFCRKEMIGAVSGVSTSCFYGAIAIGSPLAGYYAMFWGCRAVIATLGVAVLILTIVIPCLPDTKLLDEGASSDAKV